MSIELIKQALQYIEANAETKDEHEIAEGLRQAISEAEKQVTYTSNGTAGRENMTAPTGFLFQVPKAERQEPVAWMDAEGDVYRKEPPEGWCPPHIPLYAHTKREWVGLTDEEFDFLVPYCHNEFDLNDYKKFARDIQAKLKEKNA